MTIYQWKEVAGQITPRPGRRFMKVLKERQGVGSMEAGDLLSVEGVYSHGRSLKKRKKEEARILFFQEKQKFIIFI